MELFLVSTEQIHIWVYVLASGWPDSNGISFILYFVICGMGLCPAYRQNNDKEACLQTAAYCPPLPLPQL